MNDIQAVLDRSHYLLDVVYSGVDPEGHFTHDTVIIPLGDLRLLIETVQRDEAVLESLEKVRKLLIKLEHATPQQETQIRRELRKWLEPALRGLLE